MRVTKDMIHPELQTMAKIGKLMNASPSPKSMARSAKMIKRMMKGRCWSKNLNYEQIYLERSGKPQLRLCVYSPKVQQEKVPGLLWLHGGGYGKGVPEQDEGFIKRFVAASGCVVVAPDYRTSIEEPYPAALEDCYATYELITYMFKNYDVKHLIDSKFEYGYITNNKGYKGFIYKK